MRRRNRALRGWAAVATGMLAATTACAREPDDAYSLQARGAMTTAVAARFLVDPSQLDVRGFTQAVWSDDCRGIVLERACTPGTYFGYVLRTRIGEDEYVYHASADTPEQVMLADGPDPEIGLPALDVQWAADDGTCQSLWIAHDGLPAIGLCGGPHAAHQLLAEMERPEEWRYFLERFAPFDLNDETRAVSFQGPGADAPSPAWQRAIAAWASLQWFEIQAGGSDPAWGRMLAVRRPAADLPGACYFVEVAEYGRAFVWTGSCGGEDALLASTWIDDGTWERLAGAYATWSPLVELEREVEFFGQGEAPVGAVERAQLVEIAEGLVRAVGGAPGAEGMDLP